jgi:hypothetical protein
MLIIISSIIYTSTNDDNFSPADYLLNPKESAQKRYEALRSWNEITWGMHFLIQTKSWSSAWNRLSTVSKLNQVISQRVLRCCLFRCCFFHIFHIFTFYSFSTIVKYQGEDILIFLKVSSFMWNFSYWTQNGRYICVNGMIFLETVLLRMLKLWIL